MHSARQPPLSLWSRVEALAPSPALCLIMSFSPPGAPLILCAQWVTTPPAFPSSPPALHFFPVGGLDAYGDPRAWAVRFQSCPHEGMTRQQPDLYPHPGTPCQSSRVWQPRRETDTLKISKLLDEGCGGCSVSWASNSVSADKSSLSKSNQLPPLLILKLYSYFKIQLKSYLPTKWLIKERISFCTEVEEQNDR